MTLKSNAGDLFCEGTPCGSNEDTETCCDAPENEFIVRSGCSEVCSRYLTNARFMDRKDQFCNYHICEKCDFCTQHIGLLVIRLLVQSDTLRNAVRKIYFAKALFVINLRIFQRVAIRPRSQIPQHATKVVKCSQQILDYIHELQHIALGQSVGGAIIVKL